MILRHRNVERYLNGTYQRSIGLTPFELTFGVNMRSKGDKLIKIIEEEHIAKLSEERHEVREKVRESIKKMQEENKENYNKKRKEATSYEPGNLVAIKKTQFSQESKLNPKYLKPYEVIMRNV
ncbi:hypothetical protein EVAR_28952_1 [Eumeta japonica]|uniref:Uncharacterized protein n=1 Tax=Eumeta variegata TaxID=151549 RepID=A0A4C1VWY5_EUMVA|nr:hypothetical protein EVAR_28952_1 [Eumeta japonica]